MLKNISLLYCCLLAFQLVVAQSPPMDSLKQVVETMSDDSLKCEALINITSTLYSGEEAVAYGYRAIALAKRLDNPELIGRSYYFTAWALAYNEMDKKTALIDSATQIFTQINNIDGLGLTYNGRGSMLMHYGMLEDSYSSYQKAYEYYLESGNKDRQAVILNNWGICLYTMERPLDAIAKFNKALDFRIAEQPQNPIKIARVYNGLGEASKQLGQLNVATDYYLESFNYRNKASNKIATAENLINLAAMMFEAAEKGQDTMGVSRKIQAFGIPHSFALLDSAYQVPGVAENPGFIYTILEARRKGHVLYGNYENAYTLLQEQKKMDEEAKLSSSSLEALADLKIKLEREQLNIRLLEEEVNARKKKNQITLLLSSLGIMVAVMVIGMLVYQNRHKANQLLLSEADKKQQLVSLRSMLEGQEKERARVARDLHDGLGNLLSTLKVSVGSLHLDFKDQDSKKMYSKANEMIDEACTEVRKIAHEMMPQALEKLGLKKALEDLAQKMDSSHPFDAHFYMYGEEQKLDDSTNVMLYRIAQELLNNIIKYANPTEVLLQMTYSDEWLNLTVEDDGQGFDRSEIAEDEGMGLKSIVFRTQYIGGECEIDSRPGMGTLVSINVPLKASVS